MTQTQTEKARETFAGFVRGPVIAPRPVAHHPQANQLIRRESAQRARQFAAEPQVDTLWGALQ